MAFHRVTLPLPNNAFMSKWHLKIQPLRGICEDPPLHPL